MKKAILIFAVWLTVFKGDAQNHYVVTSTNDPVNPFNTVPGELRYAIEQANAHAGVDYIDFNITLTPPVIIQLSSALPIFTSPVIIDGNTQPLNGYTGSDRLIAVKGDRTNSAINFIFSPQTGSDGSQFKNLKLYDCSYIIVDFENCGNNLIQNCVINSCDVFGMILNGDCNNNVFKGNIFGTDITFSTNSSLGNGSGIRVTGGGTSASNPDNNIFGGLSPGELNYFYNMPSATGPLDIQEGVGNKVSGNIFVNNAKNIDLYTNLGCEGNNCKAFPVFQAIVTAGVTSVNGTATANDFIELYRSNSGGIDAVQLLGTVTTNSSGQWTISLTGLNVGDKIIATATDPSGNTSEFSPSVSVDHPCCSGSSINMDGGFNCASIEYFPGDPKFGGGYSLLVGTTCGGKMVSMSINTANCSCAGDVQYSWDFGDGTPPSTGCSVTHSYQSADNFTVTVTASSTGTNCTPSTIIAEIDVLPDCCPAVLSRTPNDPFAILPGTTNPASLCPGAPIDFATNIEPCSIDPSVVTILWTFSDGFTSTSLTPTHTFAVPGIYNVSVTISSLGCPTLSATYAIQINDCSETVTCSDCIGSFAPPPGDYIVSVWVREDQSNYVNSYSSGLGITFKDAANNPIGSPLSFDGNTQPVYKIIDGWQKIEQKFTIPTNTAILDITLFNGSSVDSYFDDIRIHPFNSSFKSYVYDPITLRLMAELDENNYATYYEYDEDGALIRVKKETERGVKTIKEARNNVKK